MDEMQPASGHDEDQPFTVEMVTNDAANVLTPGGARMFWTTPARARGIAAALNTTEGRKAFEEARNGSREGPPAGEAKAEEAALERGSVGRR